MPDPLWTILADPANRSVLALTLAGLVVIVFGPWALAKIAQRRGGRRLTSYDPSFETKMAKAEEIARRYRNALRTLAK
jgi:hypothetical protein